MKEMTTSESESLEIEDIEPRNGWIYDSTTNELSRYAETHQGNVCNLCAGHQTHDPDADWYCPHMDGDNVHVETISINQGENTVIIWEGGFERDLFDLDREAIIDWMDNHPCIEAVGDER